jgi:hypothetical protein
VFLLNYSSAAIPSLIAGRLTTTFTLLQIAAGYAVLVLIGLLVVLILARPAPSRPPTAAPPARPRRTRRGPGARRSGTGWVNDGGSVRTATAVLVQVRCVRRFGRRRRRGRVRW